MSKFLQDDVIKDSKGNTFVDSFGVSLRVGQYVLYPKTVSCKGGRSEMGLGVIVGKDRTIQLHKVWNDDNKIFQAIEFFEKVKAKELENNLSTRMQHDLPYFESINSYYLIVVSERFAIGWDNGSIFNT